MDHIRILKRAFSITTSYRALWIFGILLALTTGGNAPGSSGGGEGGTGSGTWEWPIISPEVLNALIIAGVMVLCLVLVLTVVATIARYVAETALIRMVDQHEATGVSERSAGLRWAGHAQRCACSGWTSSSAWAC
jgi:hypothetical protein